MPGSQRIKKIRIMRKKYVAKVSKLSLLEIDVDAGGGIESRMAFSCKDFAMEVSTDPSVLVVLLVVLERASFDENDLLVDVADLLVPLVLSLKSSFCSRKLN